MTPETETHLRELLAAYLEPEPGSNAKIVNFYKLAKPLIAQLPALLDEMEALRDKSLRFDLDQLGIELREREAVELVELRAENEQLKHERDCWKAATNIVIRGKP